MPRTSSTTPDPDELVVWELSRADAMALRIAGVPRFSTHVAFRPDNKRIAVANIRTVTMSQCQVRIWDAKSGQEMLSLVPKGGSPTGLAFTPDGRRLLASLSGRGTAHVAAWDAGPLPVEVEAALLVDRLAANRLTRAEVRSAVVAEPSLPADIRARAWSGPMPGPRIAGG